MCAYCREERHAITGRLNITPTQYTISADKLVPGQRYHFQVISLVCFVCNADLIFQVGPINGHAHGPLSAPSKVTMPVSRGQLPGSDPMPAPVQGVSATVGTDGATSIRWEPLPVGTATSYVILCTKEGAQRNACTGRLGRDVRTKDCSEIYDLRLCWSLGERISYVSRSS